mmetsp:Transcript_24401/g.72766  ORF Transcript_24401/g.72766 Transcript_24401/m.72766 type:complete len:377 (+) Transcript_24401:70-1200(+)|eukprot:CAMPEP_0175211058 /NCGR_PEP_ID=MMETSP0093-20121207/14962_1 /TAXON_ID=311494 /ORGANISM="Alexandrium monilatum, Strain CCMP3105" /LENGTH=376 /DNA_ID=CAMNT_0016504301 /DNA_START=68 /DNA_END=1198 /DNA_ORIENTATION=+
MAAAGRVLPTFGRVGAGGARWLSTSAPRRTLYANICETIGSTPVVKINRIAPAGVNLYVKIERGNPSGSIKDRAALGIIEAAERTGKLKPGGTVIEATSGNQGIAMAMVCAQRGYGFVSCMAELYSVERRKIMRMYGARVVLTPAALAGAGMIAKARELAAKHGWFYAAQFENEAQAGYHAQTTGAEIVRDFAGHPLDYFVTGYGSGGTFQGAARTIKSARPDTQVVLSETDTAAMIASGKGQERREDGSAACIHPAWNGNAIQGWGPSFIPLLAEQGMQRGLADRLVTVSVAEADETARQMARMEGIFCGTSGGATVASAVKLCKEIPSGSTVLAMVPDTAERYLSTNLFGEIDCDMNEAELEISKSTPYAQLET